MSERASALAATFEQANDAVISAVEGCTEDQLRNVCNGEGWSVAVAAHHIATAHASFAELLRQVANGRDVPAITMEMIDAANARHAEEHASIGRNEILTALRTNGAAAAATIRDLSDEQLNRTAPISFAGGAPWSAADIIERTLVGHALGHGQSIREAVARAAVA